MTNMMNEISEIGEESVDKSNLEFQADVEKLEEVLNEYMRCIKDQDEKALVKLFYPKNTPHLGNFDLSSEIIATRNNPDVINEMGVFDISKETFVNSMVSPPGGLQFEETYENHVIDTDGLIASINFDYTLFVNETLVKSGREFWQLIKSNKGWKIVSVVHSIKF